MTTHDAERLNACLDRLARGHRDDDHGVDPSLMATVDAVASLAGHEATGTSDLEGLDRGWIALMGLSQVVDSPRELGQGVVLGFVASPVGFRTVRPHVWPVRLASAVAAVLLFAIVASDYADLPGGSSTSTVMASSATTVTATRLDAAPICREETARSTTSLRSGASLTAVATQTVLPTATSCGGAEALDHP